MGPTKQQSSPKASGGIGNVFEMRVQSAMAAAMLCGGVAPCLPPWPIEKIKLQGRYAGYSTDDCIVFVRNPQDGREAKLCLQMKEELAFTASDKELKGALQAAWADFADRGLLLPTSTELPLSPVLEVR